MKTSLACAIAVAVLPTVLFGMQQIGPASLFDGKTFNGWEGNLALFRIESGAIVGGNRSTRDSRRRTNARREH